MKYTGLTKDELIALLEKKDDELETYHVKSITISVTIIILGIIWIIKLFTI